MPTTRRHADVVSSDLPVNGQPRSPYIVSAPPGPSVAGCAALALDDGAPELLLTYGSEKLGKLQTTLTNPLGRWSALSDISMPAAGVRYADPAHGRRRWTRSGHGKRNAGFSLEIKQAPIERCPDPYESIGDYSRARLGSAVWALTRHPWKDL